MMVTVTRGAMGRLLTLMFLSFVLGACGGGGGGGGSGTTTVSGYAVNGPLAGATIEFLNAAGERLGEAETDGNGRFARDLDTAPPYRLRSSGGTHDGAPYAGTLEAWCESTECHATPWSTLIVRLMDQQGFNAADARALLAGTFGFDYDPFAHELLTGEAVPESAFALTDVRTALDNGAGLDAWLDTFIVWLSDATNPTPAGIPAPEPEPTPEPEPVTHAVSASAGNGGSIEPASQEIVDGNTATLTVAPNSGYTINSVSGCAGSLSGTTYTTGPVTADCAVTASFSAIYTPPPSYTVSTSAGTGGSISPTSSTVTSGNTTAFTVTPDDGYEIDTVGGDCGGSLSGSIYTTGAITGNCTVSASFVALPTVSIADAGVIEGDAGTSNLVFTLTMSAQADGDVTVDYTTADGTATAGSDYVAATDTATIPATQTTAQITITVNGDTTAESSETLTVTLSNISANAQLGTDVATGTIHNDDGGKLNDTGITLCGDYAPLTGHENNNLDCATIPTPATATVAGVDDDDDPVPPGQDAHYGRDVTANDDSDGHAGFAFTKIGSDGIPLGIQNGTWNEAGSEAAGTKWSCVLDNVTGLMWEVKVNDNTHLRHNGWTYTWYNSVAATNGGSAGTADGGTCLGGANCDTEKFVAAVNSLADDDRLCGATDWRLPNKEELQSIADLSRTSPAIDTGFFPNTVSNWHWSSSPHARFWANAWFVGFAGGNVDWNDKGDFNRVRLVRAGQ